ncbi:hypothetical protein FPV67DRAFT_1508694 [Lyophyllum atratum]|nr:hypothetical protein FPV67DRAFT_1508694 [Lyophyllum atratum]
MPAPYAIISPHPETGKMSSITERCMYAARNGHFSHMFILGLDAVHLHALNVKEDQAGRCTCEVTSGRTAGDAGSYKHNLRSAMTRVPTATQVVRFGLRARGIRHQHLHHMAVRPVFKRCAVESSALGTKPRHHGREYRGRRLYHGPYTRAIWIFPHARDHPCARRDNR